MSSTAEWHSFLVCRLHGRGLKEIELAIAEMGNEGSDLAIEVSPDCSFSIIVRGVLILNTFHTCKLNVILAFRLGHRFLCNRKQLVQCQL